jgi:large subunit ribosomal protein L23
MSFDYHRIIKSHIVTERTTTLKQANNEYVFEVDKHANKYHIKEAVERVFNVKVAEVRTSIVPGKTKRMGRFEGKSATWKKAIVRLKDKQVIGMFENM